MNLDSAHTSSPPTLNPVLDATTKFYELNQDLHAVQSTARRIFFDYMRHNPKLPDEELDIAWSIAELLADLTKAKS